MHRKFVLNDSKLLNNMERKEMSLFFRVTKTHTRHEVECMRNPTTFCLAYDFFHTV